MKAAFIGDSSARRRMVDMKQIICLGLPALLAISATATVAAPRHGLVRLGQRVRIDGAIIRPIRVVEDSRCPANARCIWAGRLVLRTELRTPRRHERIDLTLGEPTPVAGGMLTLNSATPARYTNRPVRSGDYRVGFDFTR